MSDDKDKRPEVAKDDHPQKPRKDVKEHWSNAEDTMSEGPAGSPNAAKQSRTS